LPGLWAGACFALGIVLARNFGWYSLFSGLGGLLILRWPRIGLYALFAPLGCLALLLSGLHLPDDASGLRNTNALLVAEPVDTATLRVTGAWEDEARPASGLIHYTGQWLSPSRRYIFAGHIDDTSHFWVAKIAPSERFGVLGPARRWIRRRLLSASSSPENYSLALGLLLGERAEIPPELSRAFRNTGLTHLLAISGLNVGLLFFILLAGLSLFRVPRRWAVGVSVALIWAYTFLVGASPSVVRAAIFILLFGLANISGRKHNLLNTFGAAGLVTLAVNPWWLFDVGFQLSYAATFGILYYMRDLGLSEGNLLNKWVLAPVLVTLSAQVFVAPILLSCFGNLSLWSFPLNIPAVPLSFLILAEWVLYFIFYPLGLGAPFAALANPALDALRWLVMTADSAGHFQVKVAHLPVWAWVAWWAVALAARPLGLYLKKRFGRGPTAV